MPYTCSLSQCCPSLPSNVAMVTLVPSSGSSSATVNTDAGDICW